MSVYMLALATGAIAVYAALVWLAQEYSRQTHWQPPQGSQDSDWTLRRNVGIACGALAVLANALCSVLFISSWSLRLLFVGQAALMAAAGASDLRRFHLPLPFTLAGIGMAITATLVTHLPVLVLLYALVWSLVAILLHALVSKGSMQLGDHIATVWIALAAPFNGLLAVVAGDFANVAIARMKGLGGKKVAAAAAWLMFASALIALPPFFSWFASQPQLTELSPIQANVALQIENTQPTEDTQSVEYAQSTATPYTRQQALTAAALFKLAEWASEHTASVAFVNQRAERIATAHLKAKSVAGLAELAGQIAPGSAVAVTLRDLAVALDTYDLEAVRNASQQLADERQKLASLAIDQ